MPDTTIYDPFQEMAVLILLFFGDRLRKACLAVLYCSRTSGPQVIRGHASPAVSSTHDKGGFHETLQPVSRLQRYPRDPVRKAQYHATRNIRALLPRYADV